MSKHEFGAEYLESSAKASGGWTPPSYIWVWDKADQTWVYVDLP